MVISINDEQETSMMVERQASRQGEQAILITAMLLGADRELDSSITIKSIVSYLFLFNLSLSLSHSDKEMIQTAQTQRDEEMKLSHTRHETRERHQASKQATSNKKQQEPIDEGTKNSTSVPPSTTPSLTRASSS